MELRDYQKAAVASIYDHLRSREDNPCVVLPTGAGKTPVMAQIVHDAVKRWGGRVCILAHVKELLVQTAGTLRAFSPGLDVGVYSAGLKRRDTQNAVIVAGIQSVYERAREFGAFDLVMVDEAHLIPSSGEGRFRTFLSAARHVNPRVRLVGLTATPYRMGSGLIYGMDDEHMLDAICCEAGVRELIADGWLCKLRSRAGVESVDTSGLHRAGGEFVAAEVKSLMDDDELVPAAVAEMLRLTADRHSVLIFTASVAHAEHVTAAIEAEGHECGLVLGQTPSDQRAELLARFKGELARGMFEDDAEPLKYLANVNVLTTGFDARNIDCVVLFRPTLSPGLYYQMVGRGLRTHESKQDCLVLDFAENVVRHGPIDMLSARQREAGDRPPGEAPARECPECHEVVGIGFARCPECGHEFPPPAPKQTHAARAGQNAVLSGEVTIEDYEVEATFYAEHTKRGAPDDHPKTLRVEYEIGFRQTASQWVCVEHTGWARQKAENWWADHCKLPLPDTAAAAAQMAADGLLAETLSIKLKEVSGEKWPEVVGYTLGEVPTPEPALVPAGMTVEAEDGKWYDDEEMPF